MIVRGASLVPRSLARPLTQSLFLRAPVNYLCGSEGFLQVLEALQCFDGVQELLYCGIDVGDPGGDYSGVHIDYLNIVEFPKRITADVSCYNPFHCINLCASMRANGTAPPTCTFCNTPCPVNTLETLDEAVVAIAHDVAEAFRIVGLCIEKGIGNCVCAGALMLRPAWLSPTDFRTSPKQKCYTGDPLLLIIGQISQDLLSDVGGFFKWLFHAIFHGGNPMSSTIRAQQIEAEVRAQCSVENAYGHGAGDMCYYKRASKICNDNTLYEAYMELAGDPAKGMSPLAEQQQIEDKGLLKGAGVFMETLGLCRASVEINLFRLIEGCGTRHPRPSAPVRPASTPPSQRPRRRPLDVSVRENHRGRGL